MVKEGSDVAIIDYGINNLYSVELACKKAGLSCIITSDKNQILKAKSAILPGVGAFSVAMNNLRKNSLDRIIYRFIETGKPFLGICLGMQLLMEKSLEFGESKGLSIVEGEVINFSPHSYKNDFYSVPQIGWNKLLKKEVSWKTSLLDSNKDEDFMYFVHSFYAKPKNDKDILSYSEYGNITYCSSLKKENVTGMQFHPEKSGKNGIKVYLNLKKSIN